MGRIFYKGRLGIPQQNIYHIRKYSENEVYILPRRRFRELDSTDQTYFIIGDAIAIIREYEK
jgi:hypothetical protein